MTLPNPIPALLPIIACAALLQIDSSSARLPGGPLPDHPQLAPASAVPSASVSAADGSTFVLGNFTGGAVWS